MSAPVAQWRVHVGAHKTASTHVQMTLDAIRDGLRARGVDYVPHGALREREFAREAWRRGREAREGDAAAATEALLEFLAPLRREPGTVLLSEENLLGAPRSAAHARPYAGAQAQAAGLGLLSRRAPMTIFLAIRSFDELIPAAWAQMLRAGRAPGDFSALAARLAADPPSWLPVIRRLRAAAPEAALRVWRHADYREGRARIVAELCGVDPGPLPEIAPPEGTRTPGARAIAAVEALPGDMPQEERRARAEALFAASLAAGDPPWRPFRKEARRALRARFRKDLRRIDALAPGALMRFDNAPAES